MCARSGDIARLNLPENASFWPGNGLLEQALQLWNTHLVSVPARFGQTIQRKWRGIMLRLALIFLIIALIAAFFGFGLVASMSYSIAKILFFVFIVLAVLALLGGALRSPPL
jgi:uncharacterized membrane protein YtjA (UPF0391 family)